MTKKLSLLLAALLLIMACFAQPALAGAKGHAPAKAAGNQTHAPAAKPVPHGGHGQGSHHDAKHDPGKSHNDVKDDRPKPGNPGKPNPSGKPDNPGKPHPPGKPNPPGKPDNPGKPGNPNHPDNPGQPANVCANTVQNGSEQSPWLIFTTADLGLLHDHPDDWFVLCADLALSGHWSSVATFSGTLDGNNHTIANLSNSYGFFKTIEQTGVVKNLKLVNASISNLSYASAGGVALTNYGIIEHVEFSGHVGSRGPVGGIAGTNFGIIRDSKMQGSVSGDGGIGGIAGGNGGQISNVRVDAAINGALDVGSIAGSNSGTIQQALAYGTVTSHYGYAGGITGKNSGTISDSTSYSTVYYTNYMFAGPVYGTNTGTVTNSYGYGQVLPK